MDGRMEERSTVRLDERDSTSFVHKGGMVLLCRAG